MINPAELDLLQKALARLAEGYDDLPDFTPDFDADAAAVVLDRVARRMQDNYPYYHPQYAGQMLKPPHPAARLAYMLSMWINPNNHNHLMLGTDGGFNFSWDQGATWDFVNTMAVGQFYEIAVDMRRPYFVCGGLQDNGLWCGPSRLSDGMISKYHWADIHFGDGFVSQQDPVDNDLVWTESQGGAMTRQNLATGYKWPLVKPT
mgnify:CR=1 FL=1